MAEKSTWRKFAKRAIQRLRDRLQIEYGHLRMRLLGGFRTAKGVVLYHSASEGNKQLLEALRTTKPVFFARYGLFELRAVVKELFGASWNADSVLTPLCNNAGFFPKDLGLLKKFAQCYEQATRQIDMYGASLYRHGFWKWEEMVFAELCPDAFLTDIRVTDAFLYAPPGRAR